MQTKAEQLPLVKGTRFEQVFHRERRGCTCEMPLVSRKWNDALGTLVDVRLCCMAKTLERIAAAVGIEAPDLYEVFNFEPKWVWDCKELHQKANVLDGTVEMVERGPPPPWLLKRFRDKGIEVRNLPESNDGSLGR